MPGLSRYPISLLASNHSVAEDEVVVAAMENDRRAEKTLGERQRTDAELQDIIIYHETGELPEEEKRARELVLSRDLFVLEDKVLYRVQPDKTLRIIPPTEDSSRKYMVECLRDICVQQRPTAP